MRSKQAALMRETYGHIYVYRIYGMHYCLNLTTERGGIGAVLIRAVEPAAGLEKMIERRGTTDVRRLASGPGRLCRAFGIDLRLNGKSIGDELRIMARREATAVTAATRIGITRATELEWRFLETGSPFVSRQA
jgi:DNA-3-methyladenine glycosylase